MADTSTGDWTERAQSQVGEFADQMSTRVDEARTELQRYEAQFRAFVKERPLMALGGAIVGGYLFGRLLSRR